MGIRGIPPSIPLASDSAFSARAVHIRARRPHAAAPASARGFPSDGAPYASAHACRPPPPHAPAPYAWAPASASARGSRPPFPSYSTAAHHRFRRTAPPPSPGSPHRSRRQVPLQRRWRRVPLLQMCAVAGSPPPSTPSPRTGFSRHRVPLAVANTGNVSPLESRRRAGADGLPCHTNVEEWPSPPPLRHHDVCFMDMNQRNCRYMHSKNVMSLKSHDFRES